MSFKNSKDQSFPSATLGFLEPHHEDVDYIPGMGNTREGPWDVPGGGSFALGINLDLLSRSRRPLAWDPPFC